MSDPGVKETVSPIFCSEDANLVLRSSDGVRFKVYSKDLEAFSQGFPSASEFAVTDEIVQLTERADVLELLLQFMRRQRQPEIAGIDFDILSRLAEAVEKYEAFSAMQLCKIYMKTHRYTHPMEILNYAAKHDYPDLRDSAAPGTIGISYKVAKAALSPSVLVVWIEYREGWLDVLRRALSMEIVKIQHKGGSTQCPLWPGYYAKVVNRLAKEPESLQNLHRCFHADIHLLEECKYCIMVMNNWMGKIATEVESVPTFSACLQQI